MKNSKKSLKTNPGDLLESSKRQVMPSFSKASFISLAFFKTSSLVPIGMMATFIGAILGGKTSPRSSKGYPIRLELGMRDLEKNVLTLVRRDTLEKQEIHLDEVINQVEERLEKIQENLYNRALERRNTMLYEAKKKKRFIFLKIRKSISMKKSF